MAKELIKAVLLHLGPNGMAGDSYLDEGWRERNPKVRHWVASKEMKFDKKVWDDAVKLMKEGDLNTIVINMRDGMVFPSHPELAIKGSWTPDEMRAELKRLRGMGFDVIPKLNFSTTHSAWMKQYRRVVSSPEYYKVCADVIHDVCEIFGKPRLFHLGWDEEEEYAQRQLPMMILRRGTLWWHDFLFTVREVEKHGVRAWSWSSRNMLHHDEFMANMPSSVLQTPAHYRNDFEKRLVRNDAEIRAAEWPGRVAGPLSFTELDAAGRFDMMACGSNWNNDENFEAVVRFCHKHIQHKDRLKGFLMAPWQHTIAKNRAHLLRACDQVSAGKKLWESLVSTST